MDHGSSTPPAEQIARQHRGAFLRDEGPIDLRRGRGAAVRADGDAAPLYAPTPTSPARN
ncbi:MAG: hypothetical protein WAW17_21745 [Rhodococcus sp. (in: high G+C Gram-positive bacteria)]|uniref:hypothetical protein n=1 Tax=Rhodococcus sp. TaxID=1831 RepID=UPI003BB0BA57